MQDNKNESPSSMYIAKSKNHLKIKIKKKPTNIEATPFPLKSNLIDNITLEQKKYLQFQAHSA
jgi:hypothetical protein